MYRCCSVIFTLIFGFFFTINSLWAGNVEEEKQSDAPSPTNIAFRSVLFPGWGQATNGKPIKAVIYSGIEQGLIYGVYRNHVLFKQLSKREDKSEAAIYKDQRNKLTWYLAAAIILSAMDAFVDAHLLDFDVSEDLTIKEFQNPGSISIQLFKISVPIQ